MVISFFNHMTLKDSNNIKEDASRGVVFLSIKRVVLQVVFTCSNIVLARLLFPSDFGTFATIQFILVVFMVFCDLGLGAALIQKSKVVSKIEIDTALTVQYILCLTVVALIWLLASSVSSYFNLGQNGVKLLRVGSLSILFVPIDAIGSALLERSLQYRKLVVSELIELISGSATTVILAFLGFGVLSLVIGTVIARASAAVTSYVFAGLKLRISIDISRLKTLLKFGVAYQMNTFISLFYGSFILLYLAKQIGVSELGYFQFAASLFVLPVAFSDIVNRVIFPLGSRVQVKKEHFIKVVEQSLVMISLTTIPIMVFEVASARQLIHFVYTDKWLPSLPVLYLGLLQMGITAYNGIFSQLLLSRGKTIYLRNMGLVWAILTWILAPFLIRSYGLIGISITNLMVSITGLWLLFKLRRLVEFKVLINVLPYMVCSLLGGLVTFVLLNILPQAFFYFIFSLFAGFILFVILVFTFRREAVSQYFSLMRLVFKTS